MRTEAPKGGVGDQVIDLRKSGFLSTGAVCLRLGIQVSVGAIQSDLGVPPRVTTKQGSYWAPEQISDIRTALIEKLKRDQALESMKADAEAYLMGLPHVIADWKRSPSEKKRRAAAGATKEIERWIGNGGATE